ncbi:cytolytic toxin-alpha-like [Pelmatolapia mariae]|uniref:cytolytic toxin-alpha-like n=1 Tax=Pelmatolapia mariae TaxID=158779 RepID=UPI003211D744
MDGTSGSAMEVAALGRPFSVGMLYDCRSEALVPGMTLWDCDDLKKDVGERPQASNDFEIVASESIEDKSSALNVDASLKASFLGGLVQVDGSAKYLNDSKSSRNQARVTLKYKATTKIQELSMNHLGRDNVRHSYVFDQGLATHVVTAILYGAQAFFVFDREVSEHEDHQDVQGNLKVIINKIPLLSIEGEGSLKMEEKDKESVDKFSCKFYGDFCLPKPPTTFNDAIKVYQSLPGLLGDKAVPMKVWLLPLTALDSSAAKLVHEISIGLVQEAQTVLEDFSELEMRCNDVLGTSTAWEFPQIGKKIKSFKEMCSEFKLEFQQTFAKKLPSIRGGGEEEAELAEILKKRHSSPFNSKNLNEWMDCKEREIYTLMFFTRMMKNTKIISSQNDLYKESLSAEHVVCFVFTSLGKDEPYLSALSKYLKGKANPDLQDPHIHDVEKEQWYASKEVTAEMRRKAKLFSDFAEANKENKNMKFLTVGLTNETQEASSIYLYEGGFPVSENFEPPSKPETVTAADRNHNSVTLKISPPRFGSENITSYSVEYCVSGEDGWQQKTEAKAEEVTVRDLKPNTEYVFRCRAVTSAAPAAQVRSTTQKYVFDSVLSIFGKDVAENIRILVTFADVASSVIVVAGPSVYPPCSFSVFSLLSVVILRCSSSFMFMSCTDQPLMDPAAFTPPKELQEVIMDAASRLVNLWLEHEGEGFLSSVETKLPRLISGYPWLLDSLHPLVQNFILHELQIHPPAVTARPLASIEDAQSELPDEELPGLSEPSPRRKRRSRHRRGTPQPDVGTFTVHRETGPGRMLMAQRSSDE